MNPKKSLLVVVINFKNMYYFTSFKKLKVTKFINEILLMYIQNLFAPLLLRT
jgi:hypothetical protein